MRLILTMLTVLATATLGEDEFTIASLIQEGRYRRLPQSRNAVPWCPVREHLE